MSFIHITKWFQVGYDANQRISISTHPWNPWYPHLEGWLKLYQVVQIIFQLQFLRPKMELATTAGKACSFTGVFLPVLGTWESHTTSVDFFQKEISSETNVIQRHHEISLNELDRIEPLKRDWCTSPGYSVWSPKQKKISYSFVFFCCSCLGSETSLCQNRKTSFAHLIPSWADFFPERPSNLETTCTHGGKTLFCSSLLMAF